MELADEMVHAALAPSIGRDFDPFLFASIGEDRHGQALSVISALARSNLDPWQEAIGLSRMPPPAAIARLSRLIAALPGEPGPARPLEAVSRDLIALLPSGPARVLPLPDKVAAAVGRPDARIGIGLCVIALLMAIGLLAAANVPPPPGRAAHPETETQRAPSGDAAKDRARSGDQDRASPHDGEARRSTP
jgi:hypothetical protein